MMDGKYLPVKQQRRHDRSCAHKCTRCLPVAWSSFQILIAIKILTRYSRVLNFYQNSMNSEVLRAFKTGPSDG